MILAAVLIFLLFIITYFLSLRLSLPENRTGIWKIFDPVAGRILLIYRSIFRRNEKNSSASVKTRQYLCQLYPGEDERLIRDRYYIRKISVSLFVIMVGLFFSIFVYVNEGSKQVDIEEQRIKRNEYGKDEINLVLTTEIDGMDKDLSVTVYPREYTEQEINDMYTSFLDDLEKTMLENNPDIDHIADDLFFADRIPGYPFRIEWMSSDSELISVVSGKVEEVHEVCPVEVTAYIKYKELRFEYVFTLRLVPKQISEEERIVKELQEYIESSEQDSRDNDYWILPDEYEGRPLLWKDDKSHMAEVVLGFVFALAIVLFFVADSDLEKEVSKKKKQMLSEYSEIANKLMLYVGAGMPVRGAFYKIAFEAIENGDRNPVYKEMMYACREMNAGTEETVAYEKFGKRIGVQEYIKMSTLLGQNIKKGSNGLVLRLREEAEEAINSKFQMSRKECEEASTKLLFPMAMILLVVMVIIMFPAFSSMTI